MCNQGLTVVAKSVPMKHPPDELCYLRVQKIITRSMTLDRSPVYMYKGQAETCRNFSLTVLISDRSTQINYVIVRICITIVIQRKT